MHRIFAALALTALCFAWDASSAQALSCRNRLVDVGDPMVRVQHLCGDPASVSERVVHRTQQVARYISPGVVVSDTVTVSVTQTIWVYDFGPTRFMRELVFEGGRLAAIDTLSYGTPNGRAASLDSTRSLPITSVAPLGDGIPTPANGSRCRPTVTPLRSSIGHRRESA